MQLLLNLGKYIHINTEQVISITNAQIDYIYTYNYGLQTNKLHPITHIFFCIESKLQTLQ